jgi:hypothetical protein
VPELLYKPLAGGGWPAFGGRGRYALPMTSAPGPWMPDLGWVLPFERGYHLCTAETLFPWLHEELYAAEGRGARVVAGDLRVFASVRLLCRLRWSRADALQLFDAHLADLGRVCRQHGGRMPRPFVRTDATWEQLRERIGSAPRWYRAYAVATERVAVAMGSLSFRRPASDAVGAPRRDPAGRRVRDAFFAHVHRGMRPAIDGLPAPVADADRASA